VIRAIKNNEVQPDNLNTGIVKPPRYCDFPSSMTRKVAKPRKNRSGEKLLLLEQRAVYETLNGNGRVDILDKC
jgi:hypothetical protein